MSEPDPQAEGPPTGPSMLLWGFEPSALVGAQGRYVPVELVEDALRTAPESSSRVAESAAAYQTGIAVAAVGIAVAAVRSMPGGWALDEEGPYVVHAHAAQAFAAACDHLGRTPAALLFLPHGREVDPALAPYFDLVVPADHPDSWGVIRHIAAYPRLFDVEGWAVGLARDHLSAISRDPGGWDPAGLPIPEDVQALLHEPVYRAAFLRVVRVRLGLGRVLEGEPRRAGDTRGDASDTVSPANPT